MAEIKDVLEELNPWWKKEFIVTYKEREIYRQIKKFMDLPQIIAFNGLRRVGKTTLMLKIIDEAIKNDFEPKNIIYFSFDEFKEIEIRTIIKEYERILEKSLGEQKCLLLLDEI